MDFVDLVDMIDSIELRKGLKQKKKVEERKREVGKVRVQGGSFLLADHCIGDCVFALCHHVEVNGH